ncbi:hypothetical protein HKX48_009284 [Thoreauomyces humboldtii]|nr:hypothetical protein HKX48_009284 [Thoreauomyces humboldtii]
MRASPVRTGPSGLNCYCRSSEDEFVQACSLLDAISANHLTDLLSTSVKLYDERIWGDLSDRLEDVSPRIRDELVRKLVRDERSLADLAAQPSSAPSTAPISLSPEDTAELAEKGRNISRRVADIADAYHADIEPRLDSTPLKMTDGLGAAVMQAYAQESITGKIFEYFESIRYPRSSDDRGE